MSRCGAELMRVIINLEAHCYHYYFSSYTIAKRLYCCMWEAAECLNPRTQSTQSRHQTHYLQSRGIWWRTPSREEERKTSRLPEAAGLSGSGVISSSKSVEGAVLSSLEPCQLCGGAGAPDLSHQQADLPHQPRRTLIINFNVDSVHFNLQLSKILPSLNFPGDGVDPEEHTQGLAAYPSFTGNNWFTRCALKSASGAASCPEGLWGPQRDVGLLATELQGPGVEELRSRQSQRSRRIKSELVHRQCVMAETNADTKSGV